MSKLSEQIKEYVACPQLGKEYGEWGILTLKQRIKINELCELCDMFELLADNFYNEIAVLKRALEKS